MQAWPIVKSHLRGMNLLRIGYKGEVQKETIVATTPTNEYEAGLSKMNLKK